MAKIVNMKSNNDALCLAGCSIAFGVFDGFHRGHRFIVGKAQEYAQQHGCKAAILTFDIDPDELFRPDSLSKLDTNEQRIKRLALTDVDTVAVLHFTREFASKTPEEFLHGTFGQYKPASIHVGFDFRFGCRASGTLETLAEWGETTGVDVFGYNLYEIDGAPVTSTRIRGLIAEGDKNGAEELLGRSIVAR